MHAANSHELIRPKSLLVLYSQAILCNAAPELIPHWLESRICVIKEGQGAMLYGNTDAAQPDGEQPAQALSPYLQHQPGLCKSLGPQSRGPPGIR